MQMSVSYESKWLARIIRVVAAKELLDAIVGFSNWGISKGFASVELTTLPEHVVMWAVFSFAIAILLFRFATSLAGWFVGKPRWAPPSLSLADGVWLYIGFRALGIWFLLQGAGYVLQGFIYSAAPRGIPGSVNSGSYYLTWAAVYLGAGLLFAKKPEFPAIVVTSPKKR